MAQTPDAAPAVRISRLFPVAPDVLFNAWTAADHIRRWFAPGPYTVPNAIVDPRPGGAFDVCMRSPDGVDHRTRGLFVAVEPFTRLVIEMHPGDGDGPPLFRAMTEITFAEEAGGTRLNVVQTYTLIDPVRAAPMVAGAPEGWRMTLDKLEQAVAGMARAVVHGTFEASRTFDAPAGRVWRALTDPVAKQAWFTGPPGQSTTLERHMDVRTGGTERVRTRWENGTVSCFDAHYLDVVPGVRLVYSYVMHLDERKISVSLATMRLSTAEGRTTLTVTEHGAFLDGYDDAGAREHGTAWLLDRLGASLTA